MSLAREGWVTDALTRAGELAALEAERLWSLDIIDPPKGSKDRRAAHSLVEINRIIRRNGWTWELPYRGNGKPQWCGMTSGDVWATAGLDPNWLVDYFASTDRLVAWARYERFKPHSKANPPPTDASDRRVLVKLERGKAPPVAIRRGDIVIVGDGERPTGDHVTIAVGVIDDGRTIDTISGNGGGVGPDGRAREGISRRYYRVDATDRWPMFVIRPAFGDLLAERPV
jgi:hypothetical protein